jgi:hypothetical protein
VAKLRATPRRTEFSGRIDEMVCTSSNACDPLVWHSKPARGFLATRLQPTVHHETLVCNVR